MSSGWGIGVGVGMGVDVEVPVDGNVGGNVDVDDGTTVGSAGAVASIPPQAPINKAGIPRINQ